MVRWVPLIAPKALANERKTMLCHATQVNGEFDLVSGSGTLSVLISLPVWYALYHTYYSYTHDKRMIFTKE